MLEVNKELNNPLRINTNMTTENVVKWLANKDPTTNGEQVGKYTKWLFMLFNKVAKCEISHMKWQQQKKSRTRLSRAS